MHGDYVGPTGCVPPSASCEDASLDDARVEWMDDAVVSNKGCAWVQEPGGIVTHGVTPQLPHQGMVEGAAM